MQAFIASYPRNITPTSDDKPYFFNFTRWTDPLRSRELVDEPPHVSQGNPFFILMQLLVSAALSLLLVVGPAFIAGSAAAASPWRSLSIHTAPPLSLLHMGRLRRLGR